MPPQLPKRAQKLSNKLPAKYGVVAENFARIFYAKKQSTNLVDKILNSTIAKSGNPPQKFGNPRAHKKDITIPLCTKTAHYISANSVS